MLEKIPDTCYYVDLNPTNWEAILLLLSSSVVYLHIFVRIFPKKNEIVVSSSPFVLERNNRRVVIMNKKVIYFAVFIFMVSISNIFTYQKSSAATTSNTDKISKSEVVLLKISQPERPTKFEASSITTTSVSLTWGKSSRAEVYQIYRSEKKGSNYKKIATVNKLKYIDKKISSGKTYYYKIRAVNSNKASSSFSNVISVTTINRNDIISKYCSYFYNNFSEESCNVFIVDITNDGCEDMIIVDLSYLELERKIDVHVFTYKGKVVNIKKVTGYSVHSSGFLNLYVLNIDSKNYLYQCSDAMWQGYGSLEYKLFSLTEEGEEAIYIQNMTEGNPITDKDLKKFKTEEEKYGKYLMYTLYATNGPHLSNDDYTISNAKDIFNYGITPTPKETYTADTIQWKDSVMEKYIREKLGKLNGNITKNDLKKIKKITIKDEKIITLEDLKYCINLTDLSLDNCQITNISCLENLKKLMVLSLSYNRISNIIALKSMSDLNELYLYGCGIEDISSLKNLTKLNTINMDYNAINNIDALSGLTKLTSLSLHSNQLSDIKPLKKLTKLKMLDLGGNLIKCVSSIKGLINLETLFFNSNQISKLNGLETLKKLTFLDLNFNQIKDITILHGLTNLTYLDLGDNQVVNWTPVKNVPTVMGRPDW